MRAWRTDNTGTTYYLYGDNSTTPVCELSSTGSLTATNTYTINGITSRNAAGASTSYQFDQQGNVAERLNFSGSNTSSSTTDAFGVVTSSTTPSDPFGYIGQAGYYTDLSTGLILTTFRYYDPSNGRFVNRDPYGYEGGVNLYNYVRNSAETQIDPSGRCPKPCRPNVALAILIGIAISVVAAALITAIDEIDPPLALLDVLFYKCLIGAVAAVMGQLMVGYELCDDTPSYADGIVASASGCILGMIPGDYWKRIKEVMGW